MSEVMMLAKNIDYKKIIYPVIVTEKLDGVPADFYATADGEVHVRTRQGETLYSVDHIKDWLFGLLHPHHHVIGELYVQGLPFKDISGLVRAERPAPELTLNVFDYYHKGKEWMTYGDRLRLMAENIGIHVERKSPVQVIPGVQILDENTLKENIATFDKLYPEKEGVIIRSLLGKMEIGKRSWNFQRHKAVGTVDIRLTGVKEAIDKKTKLGNGMVGGLTGDYNGLEIGVGPGYLPHSERTDMLLHPENYLQRIMEVEFKPDPTYHALREPVFKRWRDDKTEPNIE